MNKPQHNMTSHYLFPHMKYQPDGLDAIPHSPPRHPQVTLRAMPPQHECLREMPNTSKSHPIAFPIQTGYPRQPTLLSKQTENHPSSCFAQQASIQKVTCHDEWDNRTATTSSATITTCDSNVSSSTISYCEIQSFVPKRKEEWYGEPLVRVQHRFGDELQQLRRENDILRWHYRELQKQLETIPR